MEASTSGRLNSPHFGPLDDHGVFLASPKGSLGPGKTRPALKESSSKLYRDISPTRVFAAAGVGEGGLRDECRTSLPDLFKQKKGLQSLRPTYAFASDATDAEEARTPKLLQRLTQLLEDKLGLVERIGAANKGFAAMQMRTDAHRQVFDAFLHSFTTYRSLLLRVKHEYDLALDDALASVYDNVHMRAELAAAEEHLEASVKDAKTRALEDAAAVRRELQDQYLQQEQVALEAEKRCHDADGETQERRRNIEALKAEAAELMRQNRQLKLQLLQSSSFCTQGLLKRYQAGAGGGEEAAGEAGPSGAS